MDRGKSKNESRREGGAEDGGRGGGGAARLGPGRGLSKISLARPAPAKVISLWIICNERVFLQMLRNWVRQSHMITPIKRVVVVLKGLMTCV